MKYIKEADHKGKKKKLQDNTRSIIEEKNQELGKKTFLQYLS